MTAADFSCPAPRLSVVNLEKANEKVYGTGKVLRFYDGHAAAEQDKELADSK
jgi:hypothetical protein